MKTNLNRGRRAGALMLLAAAVICSAIAVAYSGYLNRQSFIALKRALAEYAELQITFGKLQLEKSAWTSPAVIQGEAEQRLGMQSPGTDQTVIIVLPRGLNSLRATGNTGQAPRMLAENYHASAGP
ncbi:MAG: cell division protein FtsL [Pseudomonadales bacterium]